ncbi:hypothetical protein GCM10023185_26290 [Hymenobacter saemangeumensis]|uniref:AraC family transcriptional regulator n=1 Tax=Hymenobacter saemangeumensis TaxID=1084522 RepID=A0ABP8IJ44_9BACT
MVFSFGPHTALLLPFVVPGLVATVWLLARAVWRSQLADALLAQLVLLPTLSVAQWLLGYAGWYDSHDGFTTLMFYVPWQLGLALGPAYYLYFRSLTNQAFSLRRQWVHLLPALGQVGLFALAAAYDLLWLRGARGLALPDHFGTKGRASGWLDQLNPALEALGYALLLGYGLRMLADYRRYRRYLNDNFSDPERLRFAGLRQLLVLQLLALALSLSVSGLEALLGPFSYDQAWNAFALRGILIYGLIVVGLQANYAAATSPLRFEEAGPAARSEAEESTAAAVPAQASAEQERLADEKPGPAP